MDLRRFLVGGTVTPLPDREVIDALVHAAHAAPSPELAAALAEWPGPWYWSDEPDGRHLVLTRVTARRRERWWLHGALLAATFFTVTFAGAVLAGTIPADDLLVFFRVLASPGARFWAAWAAGLPFSVPLLAILLTHELGHYLTARTNGVDASPPYFIPVPLVPSFIGTLGAFIRLRSVLNDRRQLLDVGVAGPIAGFLVALPVLAVGLAHSHPVAPARGAAGMLLFFGPEFAASLGDSPLTWLLRHALWSGAPALVLHPMAFAGWIGMFVTMLNLLPLSQLDGGHVLYSALPRHQRRVALVFFVALLVLGWIGWSGWLYWGAFVLLLSRGRLGHPPVLAPARPMPPSRWLAVAAALALFVLTFVPAPF